LVYETSAKGESGRGGVLTFVYRLHDSFSPYGNLIGTLFALDDTVEHHKSGALLARLGLEIRNGQRSRIVVEGDLQKVLIHDLMRPSGGFLLRCFSVGATRIAVTTTLPFTS